MSMPKVLRCPECGANEQDLFAEQDVSRRYSVRADHEAPDGIDTTDPEDQPLKSWRLGCGNCGEQSDAGDFWTEGWLIEEEGND